MKQLTKAHPTLIALVVLTGVFLSSLDLFIVNIAFPSISTSFHGESLRSLSWVLSAYTIVFAAVVLQGIERKVPARRGAPVLALAGSQRYVIAAGK